MSYYEYTVVPAPRKVPRVKGVKGSEARFAHSLTEELNSYGADGWEYQRAETLPVEERGGLFGKSRVETRIMLIFRRWVDTDAHDMSSMVETAPTPEVLGAELRTTPPTAAPQSPEPPFAAQRNTQHKDHSAGLGPARREGRIYPVPAPDRD